MVLNVVTIAVFFIVYSSGNYFLFPVYLGAVVLMGFFVRRRLFLKWNLGFNIHFIHFLSEVEVVLGKLEFPRKPGSVLREIRLDLKREGFGRVSRRLVVVLAALHLAGKGLQPGVGVVRGLVSEVWRLMLIDGMVFSFLLIPFGLISFVFTMGMESAVRELIYAVGFFFAWFLHSGIVQPVTGLILQKRALEGK